MNEEQDELDYQELIAKVALINKDAADYMQGPMRKLEGFSTSGDLWGVVVWGGGILYRVRTSGITSLCNWMNYE